MMFIAPDKVRSKYRFVNICAQRTRQILDGATQRVDSNVKKPAYVAMQEVLADKVEWTVKEAVVPEVPETGEILQVEVGP
jgi:DNA-directed RNA polymerase omega subunit